MIESLAYYGCKVRLLTREKQRKLSALVMDYLIMSRLQKLSKTTFRSKMKAEQPAVEEIKRRQLK